MNLVVKKMMIRGLLISLLFVLLSLMWWDYKVFMGVLTGCMVAWLDFVFISKLVEDVLASRSGYQFFIVQVIKYIIIAVFVALLFISEVVNPVAFVFGVSVLPLIPVTELFSFNREVKDV